MSRAIRSSRLRSSSLAVLAGLIGWAVSALPVLADPTGWSVTTDRRGRAFLTWVAEPGAPRSLMLGCLTDVDLVSLTARLPGLAVTAGPTALDLADGTARHRFDGAVTDEPEDGGVAFRAEIDADAADRRTLAAALGPIFDGPGPIVATVGAVSLRLPVAGLAGPAKRFREICFGRRGR
jgi:hypothetical protein